MKKNLFILVVMSLILVSCKGIDAGCGAYGALNSSDKGSWTKYYYVDEFGDKTKEWCVGIERVIGTFSSLTSNQDELGVELWVDAEKIYFQLYRYNNDATVRNFFGDIEFKVKHGEEIYAFTTEFNSGSGQHIVKKKYHEKFLAILMEGGELKFSGENTIRLDGGAIYKFQIKLDNCLGMYFE